MANFEKMVAAPKEKRYRPSAKRHAANPKNLEKGRAVLRQRAAPGASFVRERADR